MHHDRVVSSNDKGVGLQAMSATHFDDRRAGLPLLQDGKLLLVGNTAAALNRWIWVHWHKVIQVFQTVQT